MNSPNDDDQAIRELALGLLALGLLAGPAAAAAGPKLALDYRVYFGGIHVLSYQARVSLGEAAYSAEVEARTAGFIERFFPFTLEAEAAGLSAGADLSPRRFWVANNWRENQRRVEIDYPADGTPVALVVPSAEEDDRDPVPDDQRRGTLDPISAVLSIVAALARTGNCDAQVPVFDGRRRYDVITEHLGEVDLKVSDLAPFGGPATRCGVMLEVLGGAWKKSGRRWREAGRPVVEVFVAPVLAGAPAVPVRIHAQNKLGALRIHLVSAERLAETEAP